MSNLDLEKIIFPNDNNTYIIRDAQAHTDLANKADKDGSNIVGPWTMNITGHASQDIASTEKRQPGGVAELDQNGLIITSQLPSSVDEIIEGYYFNNKFYKDEQYTQEITGEASKIYIDLSSNQTYRWSGSTYVEISPSIALGVEHSTAGYGDWTNTAYLHATDANKISAAVASGLYKIAATSEGHISSLTAITKADITALGIPAQDTTYSQGTGISIDNNNVINHSNSVTAGTAKGDNSKTLTFGGTFTIPSVTYDAQGHITTKGTTTMTMPGNPNTTYTLGTSGNTVTLTPSSGSVQSITVPFATNATKATQDASGNTITTTYRRLDNNTFDTISVTDLTAGDVVVTGVGRFTNGLYGNLTGNADTATNVAWSGVTGKPSTYTPASGSTYYVQNHTGASWATSTSGSWVSMVNSNSTGNPTLPTSGKWWQVLSLDCWNSAPNNWVSQLALPTSDSKTNVWYRTNPSAGTSIESGTWIKILDEKNYNDYAPTKTGTGASGTWGISVSGNAATATKATQDGSGNTITSTYLPLSGGTMTGQIILASSALKTNESAGWTMNQYGNLVHQRATTTDYWAIANNAGTYKFQVYYETGAVTAAGNITAPKFIGALQGNADTASKLGSSNVGSATQPIYLSGGTATACTYTLGKSVPSDAVFTDHYDWADITNKPVTFITNSGALATNGWKTLGGRSSGNKIAISYASSSPATWNSEAYSASIVFGCNDTKGLVDCGYNNPIVTFGGASVNGSTDNAPKWYFKITGTSASTYNLDSITNGNARDDTKVAKAGDTLSGGLAITASSSYASYNEGIRINTGAKGYATLLIGGTANSTSGTSAGAWWIGANPSNYARKLMIAHNGAANTTTYFYTNADATVTPSLRVGGDLQVDGGTYVKSINYIGTKATTAMIRFIDNSTDTYGNGIYIGGGGQTVIGGGESASVAAANLGNSGAEVMYITNDNGNICFVPNTDSGWASRKESYFSANGDLFVNNSVHAVVYGINPTNGTSGGISLYGGVGYVDNYGIAFRKTTDKGVHGYVQGDWATYFTMDGTASNRGWVFRHASSGNVASITADGNQVLNGSLTLGGNTTNTSGVRQVYNSTTKSLDFVFVA